MEPNAHDTARATVLDSLQWKGSRWPSDEFFPKEIFQSYSFGEAVRRVPSLPTPNDRDGGTILGARERIL
jgi:hypothetical protein